MVNEKAPKKGITMGTNVYDPETKTWSEGEPDFSKGFVAPQEEWDALGLGELGRAAHAMAANAERQLPPDPEGQNDERAMAAKGALTHFAQAYGETNRNGELDEELIVQNLSDLLCDLAHFCDREGVDLSDCLRRAANHYAEETSDEDEVPRGEQRFSAASDVLPALREFLAEAPLPVVDAQAVSDIIDGPRLGVCCKYGPPLPGATCDHCGKQREEVS